MTRPLSFLALSALLYFVGSDAPVFAEAAAPSLRERDALTGDWGGLRTRLADHGVTLSLQYDGEVFGNLRGGIRTGAIYEGIVTLGLDVDLEKLVGWRGATVHALGYYPHGAGPTQKLVGDLGVVSNIDFYDSARLFTLWIDQTILDGALSLRAGLMAVDEEFAGTSYGALLIDSDFGVPAGISGNFPVPIFAIAAPGVRLKAQPTDWFYVQAGAYDGNPAPGVIGDPSPNAAPSNEYNRYGVEWALRPDEGAFLIAEIGVQFNQPKEAEESDKSSKTVAPPRGLAGSYKAGFAYHTDTFSSVYDTTLSSLGSSLAPAQARAEKGNYAIYVVADQELWREPGSESQGLGAFARAVFAPPGRNQYQTSVEAGLHYTGLLPGRDDDQLALGVSWLNISSDVSSAVRAANRADQSRLAVPDYEAVVEFTYAYHVTPWWRLQPDVQWVIHPGGSSAQGNAFVVGLRSTINF